MSPLPPHWQTSYGALGYHVFCLGDGHECLAAADDSHTVAEVDVWMATHREGTGHARFRVSTYGTYDLGEGEPPPPLPTVAPAFRLLAAVALARTNDLWVRGYGRALSCLNKQVP
ncbi:hypothetical protein [Streptomyces zagrosensis]|uniref:Uncharacterized protein n=1 Tax=Streptomyces zagrosensis TaxID=1042984 RepID=A0A7W9V2N1_9ACTN|nr:hypothetical protein [Streptomyces zagrosensis]MBB5940142.1 hypothetical protein [Streptomyces zagrosensis]